MTLQGADGSSAGTDPAGSGVRLLGPKWILKPVAWLIYFVIVFEILFMISPLALLFYSAYGPALNFLHRWPSTAWLTGFFLPHISRTAGPLLDAHTLRIVALALILLGGLLFLGCAIPLYGSKILRRGAVTVGLYRTIRHPQYVTLGIVGLGTCLLWPRFLVVITYVTMVALYAALARWEEEMCAARFGESYRAYRLRTGMFLPRSFEQRIPRILPRRGPSRILAGIGIYVAVMAAVIGGAFGLRDLSLSRVPAFYGKDVAVLSPAPLTDREVHAAYETAVADPRVEEALREAGQVKRIVYVVPTSWRLPDLAMDVDKGWQDHETPADFDRSRYKVLFTGALSHDPQATGDGIVKSAYGRESIVLARVDISTGDVVGVEDPPPHVGWGDIPTPFF